jgi:hypothetical protein
MLSRPLKGVYGRLDRYSILKLVSVVDLLYFILDHVTLGFTFLLIISILAIICTSLRHPRGRTIYMVSHHIKICDVRTWEFKVLFMASDEQFYLDQDLTLEDSEIKNRMEFKVLHTASHKQSYVYEEL